MNRILACSMFALLLAACDGNGPARDASDGAALTRQKCGACHALDQYRRKVGPALKGIFGRKPTISGVPYAVWDEAALNEWLTSPRAVKKNTLMALPGIKDAGQRKMIIDYLKQL